MQAKTKNRLSIIAIVLLFATPVVVAYLMSSGAIGYKPEETKNKGNFISPPVKVADYSNADWVKGLADHWTLVYYQQTQCNEVCLKHQDELLRYRLTMANRADKLKLMIWANGFVATEEDAFPYIEKIDISDETTLKQTLLQLSEISYRNGDGLYVVAPEGYLMLAFDKDNTSSEIIQDLKLLLKRKG